MGAAMSYQIATKDPGASLAERDKSVVRLERERGCAVIVLDNPPVNVASATLRAQLLDAVQEFAANDAFKAAVLIGAGKTFVSGADLKEFGGPLLPPEMPQVLAAIGDCRKPIVAAMHGSAMGGGFELALACDARIGAPDLVIALPEVKLGIIPGAGGTQRVPRLIGVAKAIEFVTSGRRMPAQEAFSLGLLDAIAKADLRSEAVALALLLSGKRNLANVPVPDESEEAVAAAAGSALKKAKGRPYIARAVEAVRWAAETPLDEGMARERAAFHALRTAEEAFALRHLFFAEREASRLRGLEGVTARPMAKVAVIGAGTMGSGIATALIEAGLHTLLIDSKADALQRAQSRIADLQARAVAQGRIDEAAGRARLARLTFGGELAQARDADLVIEAVFEDMDVKTAVMAELDRVLKPDAILATNTSYLNVDTLAAATRRPHLVLGLHFFSPANVMRLLEIVRGAKTSGEALATAFALGRRLGKVSVLAGVCEGFIGNRIYNVYRNQCEFMLQEGALPQDIDDALEDFGFAMGPFRVGDLSGLDIAWANRKRQAATRDPRTRYGAILDKLCEAGRFGQKTGAGWYRYPQGARRGEPDPFVEKIIAEDSAATGFTRRKIAPAEIVDRALGAIINEARLVLADGIAQRASDIDLVFVHGYGFPDYRGGPLFWASRQDPARIAKAVDLVAAATGFGFRKASEAR
jgi:3-hydroxyacyl-CoA dehydrogenase